VISSPLKGKKLATRQQQRENNTDSNNKKFPGIPKNSQESSRLVMIQG
jgi:hypothetical protein